MVVLNAIVVVDAATAAKKTVVFIKLYKYTVNSGEGTTSKSFSYYI